MRSIAREVGVSPTLVSQLFRGDPKLRISDARKKEIFAARDRLGGVKVRPSRLSHVIVSPMSYEPRAVYFRKNMHLTYRAFTRELERQGFRLRVERIAEADICGRLKAYIAAPRHPDGLLIQWNYCTPELAALLREYAFPHISNDFTREHLEINTVCNHATAGTRKTLEHLAELGHRRIAFMGHDGFYRYPMMVSAMMTLGLPINPSANCRLKHIYYPEDFDQLRQYAAKAFDGWRRRNPEVTALVCSNDYAALGVIDAMRRRGLAPGRDLSVVGYDDLEGHGVVGSARERPILTTIHVPFDRVGRRMAELLLNQIKHGQTQIVHERLPVQLVVRETTGPAPKDSHRSIAGWS